MTDMTIAPADQRATIIIADDVDIGRKLIVTLLGKLYNVIEARNGLEVIETLRSGRADVSCILLDLLMPVVDGLKVLEFMREHDLLDQIPVIAITAISDTAGKLACYEAGAIDIIEKPFDRELLVNRVKFYVDFFARMRKRMSQAPAGDANVSYYTAILDSLPEAVFVFYNMTMRLKYHNALFAQLPGIPAPTANMTLAELFTPADYAAILVGVSELLSRHVQRPVQLLLGGQSFAFVFNAIQDAAGNVVDIVGTAVNLSRSGPQGETAP